MRAYGIEHRSRGVFVGWDWNSKGEWVPKFRWSIYRTEGKVFWSLEKAREEIDKMKVKGLYVLEIVTHGKGAAIREIKE